MPDFPVSSQSGTGIKKLPMPELVRYWTKPTQYTVRYRTELADAGMPMPALVFLMPMPSYGVVGVRGHGPQGELMYTVLAAAGSRVQTICRPLVQCRSSPEAVFKVGN